MFCNRCGKPVEGQAVCPACGQVQPVPILATPQPSRVSQHARVLGILWVAYSLISLLGGAVLLVLANTLFIHLRSHGVPEFLTPLLSVVSIFVLAKGVLCISAGIGLLQRAPIGRMLALIAACISLINLPLGACLGVYTLWVLLSANSEREFRQYVAEGER
jgi:hypothetical protein